MTGASSGLELIDPEAPEVNLEAPAGDAEAPEGDVEAPEDGPADTPESDNLPPSAIMLLLPLLIPTPVQPSGEACGDRAGCTP